MLGGALTDINRKSGLGLAVPYSGSSPNKAWNSPNALLPCVHPWNVANGVAGKASIKHGRAPEAPHQLRGEMDFHLSANRAVPCCEETISQISVGYRFDAQ